MEEFVEMEVTLVRTLTVSVYLASVVRCVKQTLMTVPLLPVKMEVHARMMSTATPASVPRSSLESYVKVKLCSVQLTRVLMAVPVWRKWMGSHVTVSRAGQASSAVKI